MSKLTVQGIDRDLKFKWLCLLAVSVTCLFFAVHDSQQDRLKRIAKEVELRVVEYCANRMGELDCASKAQSAFEDQTYASRNLAAQQQMAFYALAMFIVTAIGVAYIANTLEATRRAADIAAETLSQATKSADATLSIAEIDATPFVTVEIEPEAESDVLWDPETGKVGAIEFFADKKIIHPHHLWCRAVNSGRSPAIVTRICRAWQITKPRENPTSINPAQMPEFLNRGIIYVKELQLPVGPQGRSPRIATDSDAIELQGKRYEWLWFYGFVEFTDHVERNKYVSGFCYLFDSGRCQRRFHTALPLNTHQAFWYFRKVT